MKLTEWIVVVLIILVINVITLFIVKHFFIPDIKTVSLTRLIEDSNNPLLGKFKKGEIGEEQFLTETEARMKDAKRLLQNEKGIILVKESVVEGGKDITDIILMGLNNNVAANKK